MKIARAYFEQKDTAGANQFARYANEAYKPKYQYAPAYLLLGDVESAFGTDGGKAAGFYNQAINFDPKNPEGYKKWAMVYRKISMPSPLISTCWLATKSRHTKTT